MSPSINQQLIGGVDVGSILYVARNVLQRFKDLSDETLRPRESGGFLALMIENLAVEKAYFPLIVEIGNCADHRLSSAHKSVQEKCRRLYREGKKTDHISSHQSRDHMHKKYGGGIISEESVTGAFSGLSEPQNEAMITVIFLTLGWIGPEYAADIENISQNIFINPLIKACVDIIETNWAGK